VHSIVTEQSWMTIIKVRIFDNVPPCFKMYERTPLFMRFLVVSMAWSFFEYRYVRRGRILDQISEQPGSIRDSVAIVNFKWYNKAPHGSSPISFPPQCNKRAFGIPHRQTEVLTKIMALDNFIPAMPTHRTIQFSKRKLQPVGLFFTCSCAWMINEEPTIHISFGYACTETIKSVY
jgi:hypothetical protein